MNVKCTVIDKNTLRLDEDAKKGDIINLKDIQSVDTLRIEELINESKETILAKRIEEASNAARSEMQAEINRLEYKLKEKDNELSNQKLSLENKFNKDNEKEIREYKETISKLNSDIAILNNKLINVAENERNKNIAEFEKEKSSMKDNFKEVTDKLNEKHSKEIEILKEELSKLKLEKNKLGSKELGEQLESWCLNEYRNYSASGFNNCTFEKANEKFKESVTDTKGTKPDYIFRIYQNDEHTGEPLSSVCLEMKNQSESGITKNEKHYSKLDKDRRMNNCEYALLVSELEWSSENDAPIIRVPEYEKMYMVRPQYFITFLSLLTLLTNKYKELLTKNSEEEFEKIKKSEFIVAFEGWKKTYLENPLIKLENKVKDIHKEAEKINTSSNLIISYANNIFNETINDMKHKIETLTININKTRKLKD